MMEYMDRPEDDAYRALLAAVVIQAAEDYREASMELMRKPKKKTAMCRLSEAESFFLSEEFSCFTKVAGSYILRKLREEIEELGRVRKALPIAEAELRSAYLGFRRAAEEERKTLYPELWRKLVRYYALYGKVPEYAREFCPLMRGFRTIRERVIKWREKYAVS